MIIMHNRDLKTKNSIYKTNNTNSVNIGNNNNIEHIG